MSSARQEFTSKTPGVESLLFDMGLRKRRRHHLQTIHIQSQLVEQIVLFLKSRYGRRKHISNCSIRYLWEITEKSSIDADFHNSRNSQSWDITAQ